MSGRGRPAGYEGGGTFSPDFSRPTQANLNHGEKIGRKLQKRSTFYDFSKGMVEEFGAAPALAILIPMALVGIGGGSLGAEVGHEVSFHDAGDHGVSEYLSGGGESLLQNTNIDFFVGDRVAMVGTPNVGVDFIAPAVTLFDGEDAFTGGTVLTDFKKEVIDDATTRYQLPVNGSEAWKQIRQLVMPTGRRNNAKEVLQNLEKIEGYGGNGSIFVDVKRDFGNNKWALRFWGFSGEKKELGDGVVVVPEIELGSKQLDRMPVFSDGNVKNAMMVPIDQGGVQIIVELPFLDNMEKSWYDDNGWHALNKDEKEFLLDVDGNWVEEAPTPEELMQTELDTIAPNIDLSQFVVGSSEAGKAILTDKEGNVVFDGRAWSDKALINILSTTPNSCEPTDMPMRTQFTTSATKQSALGEYQILIREELRINGSVTDRSMGGASYFIPNSDNCWALLIGGKNRGMQVITSVLDDVRFVAWRNRKGKTIFKPVFNGGLIK